jgi:hypothetical protein
MPLCTLSEDALSALVAAVPSDDLLPTGLTCKKLADVCGARADRERSNGKPRWITSIMFSVARVKWAIANGASPTVNWCRAAAARGDLSCQLWIEAD